MLIVQFNNYHNATMFTSANKAVGNVFAAITNVNSYFGLKSENEELLQHNLELSRRVETLSAQLAQIADSTTIATLEQRKERAFNYNTARVVNSSINKQSNYITLDKGTNDSIDLGMGVFCPQGVVGIICAASSNYSIVLPLLNNKSNISCRIKGDDCFSTLKWEGGDIEHSTLVDLPRNTMLKEGDTVVTSGFSSIFPKDIPVGTVVKTEDSADGMFYSAKVKLFTDFTRLNYVFIVGNNGQKEQKELEKSIKNK